MTYLSDDELTAAMLQLPSDTLYVIQGISTGMFSLARHAGGMTYQGKSYTYIPATDECIRDDVMKAVAKMRKPRPAKVAEPDMFGEQP